MQAKGKVYSKPELTREQLGRENELTGDGTVKKKRIMRPWDADDSDCYIDISGNRVRRKPKRTQEKK